MKNMVFKDSFPTIQTQQICSLFPDNIAKYTSVLEGYTELRSQTTSNMQVSLIDGKLLTNTRQTAGGISARVMQGGVYGFASTGDFSDKAIENVLKAARENAQFLDAKVQKKASPFYPDQNANQVYQHPPHVLPVSQKYLIEFSAQIDAYIQKNYSDLKSRTVVASYIEIQKLLAVGSSILTYSYLPRSTVYATMVFEKDGIPYETRAIFSAGEAFQEHFTSAEILFPRIDDIYRYVVDKANGVHAQAGLKDCVISPEISGILAHEAVGHTVEADLVLSGSVAAANVGNPVASPLVSMTDFAHTALGKSCPIPVLTDDEGVLAQDVPIIEDGVLKNYMHNRETARHFDVLPFGNARAFSYSDEPLIRMRNTAILPGNDKLCDMISSIEDGYYLINTGNGQADTTGEFMFGVTMGYEIKNGRLGSAIKDTTISGIAFDVLKSVSMVGDDFEWLCSGYCGKKQPMITGTGGPSIKCRLNIGGK